VVGDLILSGLRIPAFTPSELRFGYFETAATIPALLYETRLVMFNLFRRRAAKQRVSRKYTADEITIGPMLAADLPAVWRLERASSRTPWPVSLFQDLIEDSRHTVLAAKVGTRLVGYLLYEHKGEIGHIANICVHVEYRRRGVASCILTSVLKRMRKEGFAASELEVRQTNMDAQLFYKKFGFITYEIIAAGYPDTQEDCFLMRLPLAEQSHNTLRY